MNRAELERAAFALVAGEVVALPTDTVYGLAADPRRPGATAKVFDLKGRPRNLELPVLVADVETAETLAAGGLPEEARRIARAFWPGPVTIVVDRRRGIAWELGEDAGSIGLRCPAHPLAIGLCERVGPLATTSANPHGEPPLRTAEEIRARFGAAVAFVADGGELSGPASTVVDVRGGSIRCLREEAVAFEELRLAAGV